jgi:adenylosuccinate synthase
MAVDVLLGLQWGDEGKGKIVDYLAPKYDVICRFQGGPNAGHTLKFDGKKYVLHTIPSGIFREHLVNLIGNGVVIDPITFDKEIQMLEEASVHYKDRLLISKKAHLILPTHRMLDAASEGAKGNLKIGSTLKGIGPTYMDKTGRNGLRIGDIQAPDFLKKYEILKNKHFGLLQQFPQVSTFDLAEEEKKWFVAVEKLKHLTLVDGEYYLNECIAQGKKILAEGAQGSMLDIDYGTYPYVTSSNTITAGVCSGLGIAPNKIGEVIGILKAYCTRVGSGPFPTELKDATGELLRKKGFEFGATTGRPRRCGWMDIPQLKYTIMLNGVTQLVMTKIDVLDNMPDLQIATHYALADGEITQKLPFDLCTEEAKPVLLNVPGWTQNLEGIHDKNELPQTVHDYINFVQKELQTPFSIISTGPERDSIILW